MDAAAVDHRQGPLASRARAAAIAIGVTAALSAINALIPGNQTVGLQRAQPTETELAIVGFLFFAELVAYLLAVVLWIRWFHRAYKNLPALGAKYLRYSTGWAIGAWFVPILNLFRPKAIMNDIWRASDPELPPDPGGEWQGRPVPGFINWWWALLLLSNVYFYRETNGEVIEIPPAVVSAVITVAAGILAIRVVRETTERQQQRIANVLSRLPAAAPTEETSTT